jgi:hypothetical protein
MSLLSVRVGSQSSINSQIPGWDGLLFLYGILLVPVLLSVLVGVNLMVCSRTNIDYVSMFGA